MCVYIKAIGASYQHVMGGQELIGREINSFIPPTITCDHRYTDITYCRATQVCENYLKCMTDQILANFGSSNAVIKSLLIRLS